MKILTPHILSVYISTSVYLAVLMYSLNISRGLYIVKKREETQLFRVKQVVFLKSVLKIG